MNIVIDESVSYSLANVLRDAGHTVIAIAESSTSGLSDEDNLSEIVINNLDCTPEFGQIR